MWAVTTYNAWFTESKIVFGKWKYKSFSFTQTEIEIICRIVDGQLRPKKWREKKSNMTKATKVETFKKEEIKEGKKRKTKRYLTKTATTTTKQKQLRTNFSEDKKKKSQKLWLQHFKTLMTHIRTKKKKKKIYGSSTVIV